MTPKNQSLEKAFILLREIAAAKGRASIAEIARRIQLPAATAHRLAASMEAIGAVVKEKRGHYHIGPLVADLAAATAPDELMAKIARPHLKALARRHGMTAHLAILNGDMVSYLAKETGGGSKGILTLEGTQLEAYCSGLGKALLAHLSVRERERYLSEGPFPPLTANTITDPNELRAELARTRKRGYALDNEEVLDGLKCVAVPVRDQEGRTRAALSLSGAAGDFSAAHIKTVAEQLNALADQLREKLFPPHNTYIGRGTKRTAPRRQHRSSLNNTMN